MKSDGVVRVSRLRVVLTMTLVVAAGAVSAASPPIPPARPAEAVATLPRLLSDTDLTLYRKAFALAERRLWTTMELAVLPVSDARLVPVLEWLRLRSRDSDRDLAAYDRFIGAHPDFPQLTTLQRRREQAALKSDDDLVVGQFLASNPPVTGDGRARLALLLQDAGAPDLALAMAKLAWREHDLEGATEASVLKTFGKNLTLPDHWARMDRLLWDNSADAARRMKKLVTAEQALLAEARLRLRNRSAGVDQAVAKIPDRLQGDHGLIYERVLFRRRTGQDSAAQDMLLDVGPIGGDLSRLWIERRIQVRNLIRDKAFAKAYQVARDHGLRQGASFAQGEFQAGWIALRFLNKPDLALTHFQTLYGNVSYPVSRARGAYWIGRAHLARKDAAAARTAFALAAGHPLTYYGMLAGYELQRTEMDLRGGQKADPADVAAFERTRTAARIRLLVEVGQAGLARTFLTHLVKTSGHPQIHALAAGLARDIGRENLAVVAGKLAGLKGVLLAAASYPISDAPGAHGHLPPELAHAIARQESAFDPRAVSRAGARGLMQLMPATARKVAQAENVAYSRRRLTRDPAYNTRLGGAYLATQIARFDGYLPMAAAAYNAGPHRVDRWLKDYGDPRDGKIDVVDWIELIPFSETRNYVQRVMEGLQIYRIRLGSSQNGHQSLAKDIGLQRPYGCSPPDACKP